MNLTIIIIIGTLLSIAFHFVGVYAKAKYIVWIVIAFLWAAAINISMNEIKPKGYENIKKMQGSYADTDALIKEAGEEISIYEMIQIKKSYINNTPEKRSFY